MTTYNIDFDDVSQILKVGWGDEPASGDKIVVEAANQLNRLIKEGKISGGELIRINGPATLSVSMVLAHGLSHLYQAVGCFDPKIGKYIIAITHGEKYRLGDLLD